MGLDLLRLADISPIWSRQPGKWLLALTRSTLAGATRSNSPTKASSISTGKLGGKVFRSGGVDKPKLLRRHLEGIGQLGRCAEREPELLALRVIE